MYARTDCTDAQTDRRAAYPGAECGSSYRGLTDQALARVDRHSECTDVQTQGRLAYRQTDCTDVQTD